MTEPVIMEVLAGARDDRRERDLRRLMQRFPLMRFDRGIDFDAATRISRMCRRSVRDPRGMVDCMIAAVALRHSTRLLANDSNLDRVADIMGIAMETQ